jgi:chromosome partitioning protein
MGQTKLIPLPEYARRTGIPLSTLRLHIREGRLRAVRLGHYWYIPVEDERDREGRAGSTPSLPMPGGRERPP